MTGHGRSGAQGAHRQRDRVPADRVPAGTRAAARRAAPTVNAPAGIDRGGCHPPGRHSTRRHAHGHHHPLTDGGTTAHEASERGTRTNGAASPRSTRKDNPFASRHDGDREPGALATRYPIATATSSTANGCQRACRSGSRTAREELIGLWGPETPASGGRYIERCTKRQTPTRGGVWLGVFHRRKSPDCSAFNPFSRCGKTQRPPACAPQNRRPAGGADGNPARARRCRRPQRMAAKPPRQGRLPRRRDPVGVPSAGFFQPGTRCAFLARSHHGRLICQRVRHRSRSTGSHFTTSPKRGSR